MPPKLSHDIPVTDDTLWFLERYLNVFDFLELFPADAVSKTDGSPGMPVKLMTDLGFSIESDIDREKMQLRNRSKLRGWCRFTSEHGLRVGDTIRLEKTGDRDFSLSLVRQT
ncbi:MAG: hypothetical protein IPG71_01150 [bacterium]|nr:hypothetical protein [bacterium]